MDAIMPPAAAPPKTIWSYRVDIINAPAGELAATLNTLGALGWELVLAQPAGGFITGFASYFCIFKQPL
jgi:hypothetical protein